VSIDELKDTVVNISSSKNDSSGWVQSLQGQAGAQVSLQRPLDGVVSVALAGERHWVDLGALPVDAADVDVIKLLDFVADASVNFIKKL